MRGIQDMDRELLREEMDHLLDDMVESLIRESEATGGGTSHTELKYQDRNLERRAC